MPLLSTYASTVFTETKISYVRPVGWRENKGVRKSQDGTETLFAEYYWPPSGSTAASFVIACIPMQVRPAGGGPVTEKVYSSILSNFYKGQGANYLEEFTVSVDTQQGPIPAGGLIYRDDSKSSFGMTFMLQWPEPGKACQFLWSGGAKYEKELRQIYADMLPKIKFGQ